MRAWVLAVLLMVLFPEAALAAVGTCTIAANNIVFGTFSGTEIDVTTTMTITCTGGSGNNNFNVRINAGTAPSTFTSRVLTNGSNRLNYQIYTDSTRAHIFGDNSGGTSQVPVTMNYVGATAPPVTVTSYAVLSAQALPPFGTYTSTITVTLEAGGANGSGTFQVTANVPPLCSVAANNLNFGTYIRTQLDGTTTLSATCTSTAPYNIGLDQGVAPGATVTTRSMTGPGSQRLNYGLFKDSGRTINWGATVGTDTVAATGTGVAQTFTVYGRIPASQSAGPGNYQDTITVTLTF
jgi:spore coat protein U-like protein